MEPGDRSATLDDQVQVLPSRDEPRWQRRATGPSFDRKPAAGVDGCGGQSVDERLARPAVRGEAALGVTELEPCVEGGDEVGAVTGWDSGPFRPDATRVPGTSDEFGAHVVLGDLGDRNGRRRAVRIGSEPRRPHVRPTPTAGSPQRLPRPFPVRRRRHERSDTRGSPHTRHVPRGRRGGERDHRPSRRRAGARPLPGVVPVLDRVHEGRSTVLAGPLHEAQLPTGAARIGERPLQRNADRGQEREHHREDQ
ncbi:MAG: hypothetical protein QOC80_2188 [Frankiaceae bacterium]|nr:hypothetical protein [Frankiaceae bacterium]